MNNLIKNKNESNLKNQGSSLVQIKTELSGEYKKNYISRDDAIKLLDIDSKSAFHSLSLSYILIKGNQSYYNLQEITSLIEKAKIFFKEHYTRSETEKLTSESYAKKRIPKVNIPLEYKHLFVNSICKDRKVTKVAYRKKDVHDWMEIIESKSKKKKTVIEEHPTIKLVESGKYIPLNEAISILNIKSSTFDKMFTENNKDKYKIRYFIAEHPKKDVLVCGHRYFFKEDIYNLKSKQQEFIDSHIHIEQALKSDLKNYPITHIKVYLKTYPIPHYARIPSFVNSHGTRKVYKVSEVQEYIENSSTKSSTFFKKDEWNSVAKKEYIKSNEASKLLDLDPSLGSSSAFRKLGLNSIRVGNCSYYIAEEIFNCMENAKKFYQEYYKYGEVQTLMSSGQFSRFKTETKSVKIPSGYNRTLKSSINKELSKSQVAFLKKDVHAYIEQDLSKIKLQSLNKPSTTKSTKKVVHNSIKKHNLKCTKHSTKEDPSIALIESGQYISKEESISILGLYSSTFDRILLKNYTIKFIIPNQSKYKTVKIGHKYFNKEDIYNFKTKQQEFYDSHISVKKANEIYLKDHFITIASRNLNKYEVPAYARIKGIDFKTVYKISEVKEYAKNNPTIEETTITRDLIGTNPFESFKLRLNELSSWKGFNENSQFTKDKWFEFVSNFLKKSVSKGSSMDNNITAFIKTTIIIKDMLDRYNVPNINLISSNKINLYLKSIEYKSHKKVLFNFFKFIYAEISYLSSTGIKCSFRINELDNPRLVYESDLKDIHDKNKSIIYDFEIYSKVFKYETNIDLHVNNAIKEIHSKGTVIYLSTWLYTILHLNNAWRHGDVTDFPVLKDIEDLIYDLGINSIKWFNDNKLDINLARAVVQRIRQWEMIISKTQIKGAFFCSDELAPALSTAIINV